MTSKLTTESPSRINTTAQPVNLVVGQVVTSKQSLQISGVYPRETAAIDRILPNADTISDNATIAILSNVVFGSEVFFFVHVKWDKKASGYTMFDLESSGWVSSNLLAHSLNPPEKPIRSPENSRSSYISSSSYSSPKYYRDSSGRLVSESEAESLLRETRAAVRSVPNSLERAYYEGMLQAAEDEWSRMKQEGSVNR